MREISLPLSYIPQREHGRDATISRICSVLGPGNTATDGIDHWHSGLSRVCIVDIWGDHVDVDVRYLSAPVGIAHPLRYPAQYTPAEHYS